MQVYLRGPGLVLLVGIALYTLVWIDNSSSEVFSKDTALLLFGAENKILTIATIVSNKKVYLNKLKNRRLFLVAPKFLV